MEKNKPLNQNNIMNSAALPGKGNSDSLGSTHLYFLTSFKLVSYACDLNLKPIYYQGAVKEITGYDEQDVLSGLIRWDDLLHPEDLLAFQAKRQELLNGVSEYYRIEYRIISGNGEVHWLNDMCIAVKDADNKIQAIEGFLMNVTRRKEAEEQALERAAHLDSILNSLQDVIWSVTPDTFELVYINPAAETVYQCNLSDFYQNPDAKNSSNPLQLNLIIEHFTTLLQRGWFETDFCINLPDGKKRWLHRRVHFSRDAHGAVARIDGIDTDITSRKQAEDALKYLSRHDSLTGLGNRRSFEEELQQLDAGSFVDTGLIICDIDGLKTINDRMGHTMGDRLLTECASVLYSCLGDKSISRIGGDEFTVLLRDCTEAELKNAVDTIRSAIEVYNNQSPVLPLSMSIGYAMKSSPDISMDEVLRIADNLMYQEKPFNHQRFEELFSKTFNGF